MSPEKQLAVHLFGKRIGTLEQQTTGKGLMTFCYEHDAKQAISLSMPIIPLSIPYGETITEAFFGGLLPESDNARKAIGQKHGVNANNDFALLKAIGYDCAGALSLHSLKDSDTINTTNGFPLSGEILSTEKLYQYITDLPQKPLFLGAEGLRLSLAGAQDKAPICLIENKIALPTENCPSTHILKPAIPIAKGSVYNEYLCLKIAKRVGIPTPRVEIRGLKENPFFLIERYDREIENSLVHRIHQEDFCQALGILSANKYQRENDGNGPSFKHGFNLLRQATQPIKDRNTLAKLMVFNYLIGNMDAHGKNFSLCHSRDNTERIQLAPAYDILCTRVYGEQWTNKMAMKIGGEYEHTKIRPRHWKAECAKIGYSYPAIRKLILTQGPTILKAFNFERAKMEADGFKHPITDGIGRFITQHITQALKHFEA